MKYDVAEARLQSKINKNAINTERRKLLCEAYVKSNSWEEFIVNASFKHPIGAIDKFIFWTYYMRNNYGLSYIYACYLPFAIGIFVLLFYIMPDANSIFDYVAKTICTVIFSAMICILIRIGVETLQQPIRIVEKNATY